MKIFSRLGFWRKGLPSANVVAPVAAKPPKKQRRWKRGLMIAAASTAVLTGGFVFAVHEFPSVGPWCAETARSVLGPGPVAWLEDQFYGAEDFINVRTKGDDPPTTYWEATPDTPITVVDETGKTVVLDPKIDAPEPFTP